MLAALGPACITDVTRLTIHVPANAATSQGGVVGRCATATADSAVTSAIWAATSQSTSTRAPAALVRPATRANWPSAQSRAYASCQPTSARSPMAQPATAPRATGPAVATTVTDTASPRTRLASVGAVGARPRGYANEANAAPSHWLIDSLKRPPPRLVRWKSAMLGVVTDCTGVVCQPRGDLGSRQVEVLQDRVAVRPGRRRVRHRRDEVRVAQAQVAGQHRQAVPAQATSQLGEPLGIAAQERAEQRAEPHLLAVRAGVGVERVQRVR